MRTCERPPYSVAAFRINVVVVLWLSVEFLCHGTQDLRDLASGFPIGVAARTKIGLHLLLQDGHHIEDHAVQLFWLVFMVRLSGNPGLI